jgi:hypothetical protein
MNLHAKSSDINSIIAAVILERSECSRQVDEEQVGFRRGELCDSQTSLKGDQVNE